MQQIDRPQNLYNYPLNKFVAGFIGTPQMNFFNVTLTKTEDGADMKFIDADITVHIPPNTSIRCAKSIWTARRA